MKADLCILSGHKNDAWKNRGYKNRSLGEEKQMPLHFGKVGALIAIATITAFLLWLMFGAFFEGETVEDGAAMLGAKPVAASTVFGLPGAPGQQEERIRP
ncbi:hypothetical protein [Methyloligella solikamskensis]|uniref:Uncharacterized protein n=1 Tax=Methyloligella solikamskensis TaxID=1177756 RepID=A0ABW3J6I6_9HYPH